MKSLSKIFILILLLSYSKSNLLSQTEIPEDTIPRVVEQALSDLRVIKKLKITGYFQIQAQFADSAGIANMAGGTFPKYSDNRFMVRRGRIKFTYSGSSLNTYVAQFDINEKGFALKDIYAKFTEPFLKSITLTTGIFNRPFGYEIEYSSSNRETPERSRFTQTLFPGERDLGAMLTFQTPKGSKYNWLKLDAGLFAGNGINPEYDRFKDFIGHLSINKVFLQEKLKVSGGISLYQGGFINTTRNIYDDVQNIGGVMKFTSSSSGTTDSTAKVSRKLKGIDIQTAFDWTPGITTIRGEFVSGQQAALADDAASPQSLPTKDGYIRNVQGYYIYFIQNIAQTRHQFVVKYDVFDPNTKVSGSEIGANGSNLTKADIKYSTLGLGWTLKLDGNIKVIAYYDRVINEITALQGYQNDLPDNILTLRLQYKF